MFPGLLHQIKYEHALKKSLKKITLPSKITLWKDNFPKDYSLSKRALKYYIAKSTH